MITDYFEDRSFGFICDEIQEKRFFNINNVNEKKRLLDNLSDYFINNSNDQFDYNSLAVVFSKKRI